ncbi:MAG: hypothetical protein J6I85_00820, partial [Clostridia bacterium]|nr:hypothetical protein [Clostridia bacterium]
MTQTLNLEKTSSLECEPSLGTYKFNFQAKNVTKDLQGAAFNIAFLDSEMLPYNAICSLEDEEELKKAATTTNEIEDISYTCRFVAMEIITESKSLEFQIVDIYSLNLNTIDYEIVGENKFNFDFSTCEFNLDESLLSTVNKKISFRQASHYKASKDENKIEFLLSVFVSQTLPSNYIIPIQVFLTTTKINDLSEINIGSSGNGEVNIGGEVIIGEDNTIGGDINIGGDNTFGNNTIEGDITIGGDITIDGNGMLIDVECTLNKAIQPNDKEALPATLSCVIEKIDNMDEENILYVVSSNLINGFPVDVSLLNPSETDNLIEKGLMKDVSNEDPVPTIFTPETIISDECNEKGIFTIKGKFNQNIEESGEFITIVLSGSPITCKYEMAEKDKEAEIKCYLGLDLIFTRIIIDSNIVLGEKGEIFWMKPIYSEEGDFMCPPASDKFQIDISFRQLSKFQFDKEVNIIIFYFFAVVTQPLKKEETFINMRVNLIKGSEFEEAEAICILNEDVEPVEGEQLQADFECTIQLVEIGQEYTGLQFLSSESICGIPTDPNLLNPAKVDNLIKLGEIKDYSLEENKNEVIPLITSTFINTTNSEQTGKFIINGLLTTEFVYEKTFEFEIMLMTGQIAVCTFPKMNGGMEISIECILQEELIGTNIMIQQYPVLNGYYEVIRLSRIYTEEVVNVANGKEIIMNNIFDINLTFGQVCGYRVELQIIYFIFVGFTSDSLNKGSNINIIVNLMKGKEIVEEEAVCTAKADVDVKDGIQTKAEFDCKIEGILEEYSGLVVVGSKNITGLPTDEKLLNPIEVDELIEKG